MLSEKKSIPTKPLFKLNQPDDNYKFQPLPQPIGNYPYRLKPDIQTPDPDKMIFQVVGDTGGLKSPAFQQLIAGQMAKQYLHPESPAAKPSFLYHVGDIVYHFGEAEQYEQQFFKPYKDYPLPIYAIPGNHDGDVNPANPTPYLSLGPFTSVFCGVKPRPVPFGSATSRKSGIQPNVYWTLQTPVANIIGLATNVPKYGVISEEQRAWFVEELKHAAAEHTEKAIIIALHHAPYSADFNHSSSLPMITFLESAFDEAGVQPDLVMSGHVHNYQRFSKSYPGGKITPYIVCGAGGFDELHWLAEADEVVYTSDSEIFDTVKLENFCAMQHGFLNLEVQKTDDGHQISGKYYAIPHEGLQPGEDAYLYDEFVYFCKHENEQAVQ
ncbi:metallophosphoesterase family protein [Pedobacter hartonius]|uniref:Calcineurin-like phosphoesterase n=1 Tax=Pedobacter hartonius TaxID=425514 RepID=A0A1H4D098_9SPHI|nr:metallophosphoesterase [Pedobacter hartonius]SEA65869.1 Calcineurin-like phosphoesterase [Pedobacter hartonius]